MEEFRDYGMREYKAPLSLRIKNFFMLHPMVVAILFAVIISLFMGGCSKANAAEYNPSVTFQVSQTEVIDNYTSFCVGTNHSGLVALCYNLLNTYEYVSVTYGPVYSGNYAAYLLTFYNNDYLGIGGTDTTFYTTGSSFNYAVVCFNNSAYAAISCSSNGSLVGNSYRHYTYNVSYTYLHDYWLGSSEYDNIKQKAVNYKYNGWVSSTFYQNPFTTMNTGVNGYGSFLPINQYDNDGGLLNTYNPIFSSIKYVSDSRLRIYKTSTTYGDTLNIDISKLVEDFPIEIPHQGDARLVPKQIILTINSNNTDYTYIVDASTGIWENNSTLAQVPYQWFLDADIPLQNAVITQCSFTLQASNDTQQTVSYDYYIACSYNISNQSDIIVPDIVPDPTYNNPEIIDNTTMTNIVNNLNNVSSQYNNNTGSWVYLQSLPTFPTWAAVDGINAFTPDNGSKFYTYDGSIIWKYVDEAYSINFGNYVYDNATSMYYDVIYFRVTSADFPAITTNNTPPDSTTFLGYLVFYSQRYYLRYDVYNQLSLIEAIQADAENAKTYYETVKTVLDNFDTQTIEAFNSLIGIGNTANGWFATIDGSLTNGATKIVTAIESLDTLAFDDTDILDKLDDILDALSGGGDSGSFNEDDTVSEAIVYYKNHTENGLPTYQVWLDDKMSIWLAGKVHYWFQGSNASDDKTTLLSDVFDTMTSMYDAMSDETYFFSGIQLYLESLSGSDDSDVYQDPDYVYINHFFDNSFDPDSYDGYGGGIS